MDYEEAREATVSAEEARLEIKNHSGCTLDALMKWKEFLSDCGTFDFYPGRTVLDWLGY